MPVDKSEDNVKTVTNLLKILFIAESVIHLQTLPIRISDARNSPALSAPHVR